VNPEGPALIVKSKSSLRYASPRGASGLSPSMRATPSVTSCVSRAARLVVRVTAVGRIGVLSETGVDRREQDRTRRPRPIR
jgi:hypothetical protein